MNNANDLKPEKKFENKLESINSEGFKRIAWTLGLVLLFISLVFLTVHVVFAMSSRVSLEELKFSSDEMTKEYDKVLILSKETLKTAEIIRLTAKQNYLLAQYEEKASVLSPSNSDVVMPELNDLGDIISIAQGKVMGLQSGSRYPYVIYCDDMNPEQSAPGCPAPQVEQEQELGKSQPVTK